MPRVDVKPELLRWARERARLSVEKLTRKFPKLEAWEAGELRPTLKQLESFARTTHAPIGYFLLQELPVEELPLPDFRTIGSGGVQAPSPDLMDTIHLCLERQAWYREFAVANREDRREYVGSVTLATDIETAARDIRETLGIRFEERRDLRSWEDALRLLITQAEEAGMLVMCSGIVGSNTHRALDPEEFRGFALADDLAPLVFINGKDTKAARMFTLAHEIAHIWLGQSALSDAQPASLDDQEVERWCNQVAARVLEPLGPFRTTGTCRSTSPALRGRRFTKAVVSEAKAGRTLYREAMTLLCTHRISGLDRLLRQAERQA